LTQQSQHLEYYKWIQLKLNLHLEKYDLELWEFG
jgi:hypothetical protein